MKMVEVKTSELIGPALDWAVAYHLNGDPVFFKAFGARVLGRRITTEVANGNISPSTKWSQCGPLIDKYNMAMTCPFGMDADDEPHWSCAGGGESYGPTKLIAACRAIVAANSGDAVSVPAELVNGGGV